MNGRYTYCIFQLMKLMNTIKLQLKGLSTSISRFPISTLLSFILFILLIILNEQSISGFDSMTLERLALVTTLGFFFSLSLTQLLENFKTKLPRNLTVLFLSLGFMVLYYIFFLKDLNMVTLIRFAGTIAFLIISVFYTLKKKNDNHYERYVMRIFSGFFITFLYAAVVFIGISFIILTINALFDANIDGKWYLYTFYASTFVFGTPLLLSKLPRKDEILTDQAFSKVFRALLLYILIPLIIIYTLILYVYFVQILITMEWPRGLVSNLVLWYAALSVGIIFFIYPLVEKDSIAKLFKTWFPRVILPILVMMFVSIGLRINQYGFTENRYYVVLLGLFVFITMSYFAVVKKSIMIFVPMLLSIFVLISVYGPASALEVSYFSQNQRLTSILEENEMLINGTITPKRDLTEQTQKDLSSIATFFVDREIEKMNYVDSNFTLSNFSNTFGFSHMNDYDFFQDDYYYVSSNLDFQPIMVKGYDYLFNVDPFNTNSVLDGYEMTLKNTTLDITKDGEILFSENLEDELTRIILEFDGEPIDNLSREDAIISHNDSTLDMQILLKNLSARKTSDENFTFDSVSLLVLFTP